LREKKLLKKYPHTHIIISKTLHLILQKLSFEDIFGLIKNWEITKFDIEESLFIQFKLPKIFDLGEKIMFVNFNKFFFVIKSDDNFTLTCDFINHELNYIIEELQGKELALLPLEKVR